MVKDKAKSKTKKRRNNANKPADDGVKQRCPNCNKTIKPRREDGISKSKQETQASNNEAKSSGNDKPTPPMPMPSLSDQERMSEESEEELIMGGNNNAMARPPNTVSYQWPTFSDLERMFEDSDDEDAQ